MFTFVKGTMRALLTAAVAAIVLFGGATAVVRQPAFNFGPAAERIGYAGTSRS